MAFCVALTEETRVAPMRIPAESATTGGAGGVFDGTTDYMGEPIDTALEVATLGYSMDDLLKYFDLPFPNHIKIDVDGDEDQVIAGGARNTLRDPRLISLMVELTPNAELRRSVHAYMKAAGFIRKRGVASVSTETTKEPATVTNNFFVRPA
jgi:hypothetical protein